ncbi:hypothetical protein CC80DRAFT_589703 [Byssothecium circinans]|uniref:Uncharacterized protein n=1 Tax=Byssothecium circinans TaxID=147558 RepID=A0A6A5U9B3_9PLEO|nr:hypothetical protein CC80DRAFT_589703 [Byssothecium circinans]
MTPAIRAEFLEALHKALGALDYGIIGGTALAEFGNPRATSDIDVMVPRGISEVVEPQLLARGMVRTAGGGLGYIASDGNCYGIDFTTDRNISQEFSGRQETFLLDSKAYSYMTRVGPDADAKRLIDANDLFFIIDYMKERQIRPDRRRCRWVLDYDFWTTFTRAFEGAERLLLDLGLQRDATPSDSNRSSRRASSGSRTSGSSGRR